MTTVTIDRADLDRAIAEDAEIARIDAAVQALLKQHQQTTSETCAKMREVKAAIRTINTETRRRVKAHEAKLLALTAILDNPDPEFRRLKLQRRRRIARIKLRFAARAAAEARKKACKMLGLNR